MDSFRGKHAQSIYPNRDEPHLEINPVPLDDSTALNSLETTLVDRATKYLISSCQGLIREIHTMK